MNCGIPIPPINGSIVNYSGTKLLVTFKCDEGFRPSAEVVGTCGSDTRWNPAPSEHNCTFIKGIQFFKKVLDDGMCSNVGPCCTGYIA